MRRTEVEEFESCSECGSDVHASRDRTYAIDAERMLCFACALRRGGSYDEGHDFWKQAPDLEGLAPRDRE